MRERLKMMIAEANVEWLNKEYDHETDKTLAEYTTDHLLANGVVIIDPQKYPPVNNQRIIKTVLGVSLDEMAELIDAKQEGRIIVLPCKVGDTVYYISGFGGYEKICEKKSSASGLTMKGWYLRFGGCIWISTYQRMSCISPVRKLRRR